MKSWASNKILSILDCIYHAALPTVIKSPQLRAELHILLTWRTIYENIQHSNNSPISLLFKISVSCWEVVTFWLKRNSTSKFVYRSWGILLHMWKTMYKAFFFFVSRESCTKSDKFPQVMLNNSKEVSGCKVRKKWAHQTFEAATSNIPKSPTILVVVKVLSR